MSDNLLSPVPCGFLLLEERGGKKKPIYNKKKKAGCVILKTSSMWIKQAAKLQPDNPAARMFSYFTIDNWHVVQPCILDPINASSL